MLLEVLDGRMLERIVGSDQLQQNSRPLAATCNAGAKHATDTKKRIRVSR